MTKSEAEHWITSKEIIEITGISRATLNNYIKSGIIPKPVVQKPKDSAKKTKRIGYFPSAVSKRISIVKSLKRKGNSMSEIAETLRDVPLTNEVIESAGRRATDSNYPPKDQDIEREGPKGLKRITDETIQLTLSDITSPAYLINKNFEIEWINEEAEKKLFKKHIRMIEDLDSRNIFRLLFEWEFHDQMVNWQEILSFHIKSVKFLLDKNRLNSLYQGMSKSTVDLIEKIYDDHPPSGKRSFINKEHLKFVRRVESEEDYDAYVLFFREGIFFVYLPADEGSGELESFLGNRQKVLNELLGQRIPSMVSLCVLVADIQDSVKISAELPPAEYFELINQFWRTMRRIFEKYHGVYGKHTGDGLLYYFIKKQESNYMVDAIHCALELRREMAEFSNKWKIRKKWLNDLYLNIGINEGKEYFGSIRTSTIEYTALGDTINYAGRLSDFARYGSIWTTKNLLNKLSAEELSTIDFGIRRKEHDREIFVKNSYSRLVDLLDSESKKNSKFMDISMLPVAEIIDKVPISAERSTY